MCDGESSPSTGAFELGLGEEFITFEVETKEPRDAVSEFDIIQQSIAFFFRSIWWTDISKSTCTTGDDC